MSSRSVSDLGDDGLLVLPTAYFGNGTQVRRKIDRFDRAIAHAVCSGQAQARGQYTPIPAGTELSVSMEATRDSSPRWRLYFLGTASNSARYRISDLGGDASQLEPFLAERAWGGLSLFLGAARTTVNATLLGRALEVSKRWHGILSQYMYVGYGRFDSAPPVDYRRLLWTCCGFLRETWGEPPEHERTEDALQVLIARALNATHDQLCDSLAQRLAALAPEMRDFRSFPRVSTDTLKQAIRQLPKEVVREAQLGEFSQMVSLADRVLASIEA